MTALQNARNLAELAAHLAIVLDQENHPAGEVALEIHAKCQWNLGWVEEASRAFLRPISELFVEDGCEQETPFEVVEYHPEPPAPRPDHPEDFIVG